MVVTRTQLLAAESIARMEDKSIRIHLNHTWKTSKPFGNYGMTHRGRIESGYNRPEGLCLVEDVIKDAKIS